MCFKKFMRKNKKNFVFMSRCTWDLNKNYFNSNPQHCKKQFFMHLAKEVLLLF